MKWKDAKRFHTMDINKWFVKTYISLHASIMCIIYNFCVENDIYSG